MITEGQAYTHGKYEQLKEGLRAAIQNVKTATDDKAKWTSITELAMFMLKN